MRLGALALHFLSSAACGTSSPSTPDAGLADARAGNADAPTRRGPTACSCLVSFWNAGGWSCPPCVLEGTTFSSAVADDPGLSAFEMLAFDYDSVPNVSPPSRADLDDWVSSNRESFPVEMPNPSAIEAGDASSLCWTTGETAPGAHDGALRRAHP